MAAGPGACGCSVDKWHGGENHAESADGQRTRPLGSGVANTSALECRSHDVIGRAVSFSAVPPKAGASDHLSPTGIVWPWALLVMASAVLPWWFVQKLAALRSQSAVYGSTWPVLLGALLAVAIIVLRRSQLPWRFRAMPTGDGQLSAGHLPLPCIPPGDLLLPIGRGIAPVLTHGRRLAEVQLPRWRDALLSLLQRPLSNVDGWRIIGQIEDRLNHWSMALVILVLLGLIVTALGMSE